MTKADLTEQMFMMMEMAFTGLSILITIVSAYIVGLYWFLVQAHIGMRIIAFSFFSIVLGVLGVTAFGAFSHAQGINLALEEL
jgi:membrane protein implicated in regulation of membrane protease activity